MPKNTYNDDSNQSTTTYVYKKRIYELFEAMMTALMVHKPDDHITFIRKCLDKVEFNPNDIRWNHFLTKSSSLRRKRPKSIIFILSSSGSLKLCARLLERYHQVNYLPINCIANIDDDEPIDLQQYEYRYESVQKTMEQHRMQANGFLIAGELDEQKFLHQWQRQLGRIDLIFILSFDTNQILRDQNLPIVQIDLNNDFVDILATAVHYFDELFPQDAFLSQRSPMIFCVEKPHLSTDDDEEEENNNSFTYTLCQRLAEDFSFKHIHYGELNKTFWNFEKLKDEIRQPMSRCSGYIIDHFPTSFDDLNRFQSEIGPCSALIYIGDHRTVTKADEINRMIDKFQENKQAIYVDCRMEVDEIYDDLKRELLLHL